MGQTRPLFAHFCSFQKRFYWKIVDYNGIQTQIDGEDGKHADHLTITTAQAVKSFNPMHSIY